MKIKSLSAIALLIAGAAPIEAQAATITLKFRGPTSSGRLALDYMVDPNTAAVLGQSPNTHDPLGSFIITDARGTFSDTALGIVDEKITKLEPLNPVAPETTNLEAPSRFSLLPVANGVDDGSGHLSPGFHYDNIYYPAGSPLTSSDYPFSGGWFDIYGVAFQLGNGDAVNLWSNGVMPIVGLNYGVAITDRTDVLDYTNGVLVQAVPEPASWALMIGGFGLLGTGMRRRRAAAVTA